MRRYNAARAPEAAAIRVSFAASRQDTGLQQDSAAVVDWGRRQLADFLRPRDFGDVETDALVMLSLLSAFGRLDRPPAVVDSAAYIIERGLLGR